ncbi:hypothetical protein [Roseicella aquatilis]|uniref:Uncharacterized protein n=1 Tax=Roseicella aquatilis TaxID=2527868 RepID=A0A4R4D6X7_9PROT|nr:hypothetical protein [Roseicella aquatilis]TCZ55779.1 hypothetical protein EXY23_20840 [Roseicella aquatilis]
MDALDEWTMEHLQNYLGLIEKVQPFVEQGLNADPPFRQLQIRVDWKNAGSPCALTVILANEKLEGRTKRASTGCRWTDDAYKLKTRLYFWLVERYGLEARYLPISHRQKRSEYQGA